MWNICSACFLSYVDSGATMVGPSVQAWLIFGAAKTQLHTHLIALSLTEMG